MPTTTAMTDALESLLLVRLSQGSGTINQITHIQILSALGTDGTQTEMTGTVGRQGISLTATSTSGSPIKNTNVITFTNSGWASTSVYGVAFYTADTGGACYLYGNFDSVVTVAAGQSLQFNVDGITISMD
jgi:hypothetical protein